MKLELLVHNLREQTRIMSSVHSMQRTAAYKELLAHGQEAVPTLLLALDARLAVIPVMALLVQITGDNPVLPADAGIVDSMRQAWLAWGRTNNLIRA
jgi:hypothetical protein